jgi:hypothetical protein
VVSYNERRCCARDGRVEIIDGGDEMALVE